MPLCLQLMWICYIKCLNKLLTQMCRPRYSDSIIHMSHCHRQRTARFLLKQITIEAFTYRKSVIIKPPGNFNHQNMVGLLVVYYDGKECQIIGQFFCHSIFHYLNVFPFVYIPSNGYSHCAFNILHRSTYLSVFPWDPSWKHHFFRGRTWGARTRGFLPPGNLEFQPVTINFKRSMDFFKHGNGQIMVN